MYVLAIVVLAVLVQSCDPVPNLDQKYGAVTGVVTDATTGEPIVGCEVYLSRYTPAERIAPRDFVLTDSEGYYEFAHVHFGKYNVAAIAEGYEPSDNVVIVLTDDNDDDWLEVDFQLVKEE